MTKRTWPKGAKPLDSGIWGHAVWLITEPKDYVQADLFLHKGEPAWGNPLHCGGKFLHDETGTGYHNFTIYSPDGNFEVFVHELAHCALTLLKVKGVRDVSKDQEQFCYTMSHLYKQAEKHIKPKRVRA